LWLSSNARQLINNLWLKTSSAAALRRKSGIPQFCGCRDEFVIAAALFSATNR